MAYVALLSFSYYSTDYELLSRTLKCFSLKYCLSEKNSVFLQKMLVFEKPSFFWIDFLLKGIVFEKPSLSGEKPGLSDEPRFRSEKPKLFCKLFILE